MAVFMVETYVVKPEKQEGLIALAKKFAAWKEKNPLKPKKLESWKMFAQMIGGNVGGCVELGV
jgi:hypothetical protein